MLVTSGAITSAYITPHGSKRRQKMYLKRTNTLFFHFTEVPGGLPKEKLWFLAGTRFLKDLQISLESLAAFDYNDATKTLVVRFKQQEQLEDGLRRLGEVTQFKDSNGNTFDVPITSSLNPGRNSRITISTFIKWVPIEMDFKLVEKALAEYGTVVESSRISINPTGDNGKACKVETERIRVAMRLKKDIPTTVTVDGVNLRVFYAGQPPTCNKCKRPGHIVKDCPKKKRGWEADDTEETDNDDAANNTAANSPDPTLLQQGEAQGQQNEPENPPKAPPAQPTPQGKNQKQKKQLKKDHRAALRLQQELNKQVEGHERPLSDGQRNEPLGKVGDQQQQLVQSVGDQPEASTSQNTMSIEPCNEEMGTTPASNPKKSTKRGRASPRKNSKEYSDSERNQKKKRGQLSESDRESESESSMDEEEVNSDEDILSQSQEHQGPVAQLVEGPTTYTTDQNQNQSQNTSTVVPLAEGLSTIQTPRLDISIVKTVDLTSVITQSEELPATNSKAIGLIPGTAGNQRPKIPALFGLEQPNPSPETTQVTAATPKTYHAGNTEAIKAITEVINNQSPKPCEKTFNDRHEREGTLVPPSDGQKNPTSGTGPPRTL